MKQLADSMPVLSNSSTLGSEIIKMVMIITLTTKTRHKEIIPLEGVWHINVHIKNMSIWPEGPSGT